MKFSVARFCRLSSGLVLTALFALAACSPATPVPPPDALVAPKQLATVILTSTPVGTPILPPTSTALPTPTISPVPPTPTTSPTPYVGVFMGDGSAPVVLPTAPIEGISGPEVVVNVTLQQPTPLGGPGDPVFPTATIAGAGPAPAITTDGSTTACTLPVDAAFSTAYQNNSVGQLLGCPVGPAETPNFAGQPFEYGSMIWRSTGEIYALAQRAVDGVDNRYWRAPDTWQEGMPADDPSLTAPENLYQPIRGFGLAWRTYGEIRNALGWATDGESAYSGTWQVFERGVMMTARGGGVYALVPDNPAEVQGAPVGLSSGQFYGPMY